MIDPGRIILPAILALALAACGGEPPAPESSEAAADTAVDAPPVSLEAPSETPEAGASASASAAASDSAAPGARIPSAIQGRWGLVPADCTSTRGDAKGLLVIGPDMLKFYESTARAGKFSEESSARIRANFAFSGEGTVWTREMVLETSVDGKTLTRRDFGGDTGPDPLIYTRC